jgi:hypothetical protein
LSTVFKNKKSGQRVIPVPGGDYEKRLKASDAWEVESDTGAKTASEPQAPPEQTTAKAGAKPVEKKQG